MRYIVITAKHHEGFALFRSSDPFNVVDATPFGRDPLRDGGIDLHALTLRCYR